MARTELEALVFSMDANFSKMQKKLDRLEGDTRKAATKAQASFDKLGASIGGQFTSKISGAAGQVPILGDALMSLGGPASLTAAAGLGAVAAALAGARQAAAYADDIGDVANRLHVTTDALQEYRYAIRAAGGDEGGADEALEAFSVTLGKAQQGLAKSQRAFLALGFTKEQINGFTDAGDALDQVTKKISGLPSIQQDAIVEQLGLEKIKPLIEAGADEMQRLRLEAHKVGVVMDAELVKRGGDINDEFETVSKVIDVQLKSALVDLGPILVGLLGLVAKMAKFAGDFADNMRTLDKKTDRGLDRQIASDKAQIESIEKLRAKGAPISISQQNLEDISRQRIVAAFLQKRDRALEAATQNPDSQSGQKDTSNTADTLPPRHLHSVGTTSRTSDDSSAHLMLDASRDQLEAYRNFAQAMQRAQADTLAAQQDMATTAAERLTLAQAALTAEYDARRESNLQASLNGDLSEADAAALDAQDRQTEALRQAALLREGEVDILRERLDAERTMDDLTAGYLQIIAATADTAEERRQAEQTLLAMAQKQARDQLEADIAANPSRYPNPQAARDSLGRIERAQNTAFGKDHEGPLKRYFDDIKDMNTYLQTAASEGLADFNQGILEMTRSGAKAGQILQRVAQDLLAKLAMSGLKQGEQAILNVLKIPGFATGTDSAPGGLALVGEKGPELLNLPRGSKVFTSNLTKQFLSGGAARSSRSTTVNQTLHFHNQGAVLAEGLVKEMKSFAVGIGVEAAKGGGDIAAYNQSRAARRQLK